ncbi:MAG: SUMF1/EgtB/PvdO family nonheme iron enzyme, partial [Phycisphaeraceae bacterium]|nr:SUMF1/EgtB/PvdO family nonheme iron enzyme [Phycisphaeraceae bacterium]
LASIIAAAAIAAPALAGNGIDPVSGIDFVRITHPGNAPWMGSPPQQFPPIPNQALGRGGVGYEYFIGRFEVTTSQWVQFFNAAYDRPAGEPGLPWLIPPTFWGATGTTPINNSNPNARRWQVPSGNEMRPVGNISWRMAAIYCNFLHNGGAVTGNVTPRENFLSGAYDVSTFGNNGTGGFSDQATRSPDARYWIPSWDEWLKAAHYDPHKDGPDQGGWWAYPNGSDSPLIPGPPGVLVSPNLLQPPHPDPNGVPAQTNYGWEAGFFPGYSPFTVPLGAYSDVQSPWGLFDVSGATTEWTEEIRFVAGGGMGRAYDGSYWNNLGSGVGDPVWLRLGETEPWISDYSHGLRIASTVPGPSVAAVLASGCVVLVTRRKRKG